VIALAPNDQGAHYDLANCYEKMGQTDKAVRAYTRYAELVRAKDPEGAKRAQERAASIANP
jgi:Flp pilus assembly protein TadD